MDRKITFLHSQFNWESQGIANVTIVEFSGDQSCDTGAGSSGGTDWTQGARQVHARISELAHCACTFRLYDKDGAVAAEKSFRRNIKNPTPAMSGSGFHLVVDPSANSADLDGTLNADAQSISIQYRIAPDQFSSGMMEIELLGKIAGVPGLSGNRFETTMSGHNQAGDDIRTLNDGAGSLTMRLPFTVEDI